MSDVKIAGCHECPLYDGERGRCLHPEGPHPTRAAETAIDVRHAWQGHDDEGREVFRSPAWCPLRQGALTITLATTKGSTRRKA